MRKRKTSRIETLAGLALAGLIVLPGAVAAQVISKTSDARPGTNSGQTILATGSVVREIDDPTTGRQWLLMRDPAHPGGPGVLVSRESVADGGRLDGEIVRLHPVIRAGDRLTVEQSSARFDLRLEGIALSPAAPGASLRVRLAMTGKVVQVVALGPGRAVRVQDKEIWP
jgi:hypothetical protein